MKESVTYQAILKEGLEEGLALGIAQGREQGREVGEREATTALIRRLGEKRLGIIPDPAIRYLEQANLSELQAIAERLLEVESWDELFEPTDNTNQRTA